MSENKNAPALKPAATPDKLPSSVWAYLLFSIRHSGTFWLYFAVMLTVLAATGIDLAFSFVVHDVVELAQNHENIELTSFMPILWLVLALQIGVLLAHLAETQIFTYAISAYSVFTKRMLFNYTQSQSHDYFIRNSAGEIAHKITDIPWNAGLLIDEIVFTSAASISVILLSMVFLLFINPWLALVTFVWGCLYVTCCFFLGKKCGTLSTDRHDKRARVSGVITDSIINNQVVRLFGKKHHEFSYMDAFLSHEYIAYKKLFFFQRDMFLFRNILIIIYALSMLGTLVWLYLHHGLTLANFALALTMMVLVIDKGRHLLFSIRQAAGYYGGVENGLELIAKPLEMQDVEDAENLVIEKGEILFNNINFSYNKQVQVFDGMDLKIPAGQKIGIVGTSGAGKSTLVNLLLRFYDIDSNEITIDRQNISKIQQESLRQNIAVIPQDTSLFHRTIMENIRYGRVDATDEEVIDAAKRAHIHDFIFNLPDGYNTLVGERGVRLSGGQRQRIAIARAILKNAQILILDEATSALDSESEKFIQQSLVYAMKDKTVIAIAHRLSTIMHMDKIIVFDDGKVVEDGSHEDLLRHRGIYAKLWSMQSEGFLPE